MKQNLTYREEFLPINRKKQYLLHFPCEKKGAPVILFLHSGTCMPGSILAYTYQKELSSFCNVVYWDHLGTGKTLTAHPKTVPTMDRLLQDLFVIISCLKLVYGQNKVVLLGHSYGSVLGALYAQQHPEDVACYIGAGQIVNAAENERSGLQLLKERIQAAGKAGDLRRAEALEPYPADDVNAFLAQLPKLRKLQAKYQLNMGGWKQLQLMLHSPVFQWADLRSAAHGLSANSAIWEYLLSHSFSDELRSYKMPICLISGDREWPASREQAKAYWDAVDAPEKHVFELHDAGHYMMLDQPKQFAKVLQNILQNLCSAN